jgi:hypothetical protein
VGIRDENVIEFCILKVFSQPIIDHNWESRYYSGNLVATCGHFVAYALKRK